MTDQSDAGNGQQRHRRKPRLGESRAPVTTLVVLVAATVAVIAGFVVLRSVTDPAEGSDEATGDAATVVSSTPGSTISAAPPSTTGGTSSTTTSTTTTVAPRASKSDATVVVANASGVDQSATAMTEELEAHGYTTSPVANATGSYLDQSIIYYLDGDDASLGVARLLAEQIPTARTIPMPDPPPLDRPLNGATVVLLLGLDAAGRSLSDLATD
jgi:LytR cell envelope-related transcriptional attenuator